MFISPASPGLGQQQEFMSLPMTKAEYERMQQLEKSGMSHEAAKAHIYAERGPDGQPRSTVLPVAVAKPIGFFGKVGLWMDEAPWWQVGLAGGATFGVLAFAFSRLVKVGRTPDGKLTSRFGGADPVFDDMATGALALEDLDAMDAAPTGAILVANPCCTAANPPCRCGRKCRCKKPCRCR